MDHRAYGALEKLTPKKLLDVLRQALAHKDYQRNSFTGLLQQLASNEIPFTKNWHPVVVCHLLRQTNTWYKPEGAR